MLVNLLCYNWRNNLRSRGSRGRRNKEAVYLDDDGEEYVYANGRDGGPTIREISEEEADMSIPKRRKGLWGKFVHNDDWTRLRSEYGDELMTI